MGAILFCSFASCASTGSSEEPVESLNSEVELFLWLVGISGDVSTGGGAPDSSLDDPLALEGGGLLQGEIERGGWALRAEGLYVDYEGATSVASARG